MKQRFLMDFIVGLFILLAGFGLLMLAFKVSGLTSLSSTRGYHVYADFTNIGGLKVRAPVTIAGVRVGEVTDIQLDEHSFNAKVTFLINDKQNKIPAEDAQVRILTEGLLGSNYISITPGFEAESEDKTLYLREGDKIQKTHEAIILENLIGQLLFNINK